MLYPHHSESVLYTSLLKCCILIILELSYTHYSANVEFSAVQFLSYLLSMTSVDKDGVAYGFASCLQYILLWI